MATYSIIDPFNLWLREKILEGELTEKFIDKAIINEKALVLLVLQFANDVEDKRYLKDSLIQLLARLKGSSIFMMARDVAMNKVKG